jgi:hypothetical protein
MEEKVYKDPSVLISILQLITFIASYLIIYSIIGIICLAISNFIAEVQFFKIFLVAFPVHETVMYTMLPIISGYLIFALNDFIYKKYYFNLISTAIFFMFLSWLMVDHIINTASKYGIISWNFGNWLWSDALLVVIIFTQFFNRTRYSEERRLKNVNDKKA